MTVTTSSRFSFKLAARSEDSALRAVLRSTSMQGKIRLSFQREPDFFLAEQAGNINSQVMAAMDETTGRMAGFGCRSFRRLFVDGQDRRIGYLSGLRSLPEYRNGTLLVRGYRFLKTLHADGKVPYYITTIFDDNTLAKNTLTSGRGGLPVYHEYANIRTFLLPLYRHQNRRPLLTPYRLDEAELGSAVRCINECNHGLQFSSSYTTADLTGENSLLPAFNAEHLYGVKKDGKIVATMGLWNQHSFKQSIVAGYSPTLRLFRPMSNLLAKAGFTPRLPKMGETLPYLHTIAASSMPGHSNDLTTLLEAVVHDWSGKGYTYLVVGTDERHPLAAYLSVVPP